MVADSKPASFYIIRGAIYIAVGVIFTFSEFAWQLWSEKPCDPPDTATESALVTRKFYTYLTTMDWRKPQNRYTSVITVRENREPRKLFDDFCAHREFLAALIKEIRSHDPASIVVDNYFSSDACPTDSQHPEVLSADGQLTQVLSTTTVPVILGLHTLKKHELERLLNRRLTATELESFSRACQVVHDNIKLDLPQGALIRYGLIRFNADTRKLPLSWPVFLSPDHVGPEDSPIVLKTLAAQAAATIPGAIVPDLDAHPYTSFLREDEIRPMPAMEVLCVEGTDWRNCAPPGRKYDERFRHRVVLIGDDTDDEQRDTPVGQMAGVFLHANYIEALGSSRFFRPIRQRWQILGGVLLMIMIEFIYVKSRKPLLGLVFSICSVAVLWFVCAIVAAITGILPVIWVPSAVALFLRFGEAIRERTLEEKAK
jgi:hypothetical protein